MSQSQSSKMSQTLNKQGRASLAKQIINDTVPALLASNQRAARGVRESKLFRGLTDLPSIAGNSLNPTDAQKKDLKISIVPGDTYDVAREIRMQRPDAKMAALNMASPVGPGGGVLRGAKAQEEALCMRSTLLPSLKTQWYRLPEDAVIWTDDVLVFGEFESNGNVKVLDEDEMWYLDIVTCAAVKKPALKGGRNGEDEDYADPQDEARMVSKVKYIMRACAKMGCSVVVLGAWGCGAYHNPVKKVAKIMRNCLVGGGQGSEDDWAAAGIEEVVFAIFDETPQKKVLGGFVDEFKNLDGVAIGEPS